MSWFRHLLHVLDAFDDRLDLQNHAGPAAEWAIINFMMFVARPKADVVQFDIDVTEKASKKRMQMSEVGIYTVKDGKVSREEFLPLAQKKE